MKHESLRMDWMALVLLFLFSPVTGWATVYVDGDQVKGPRDGNSWATAYRTVEEGLDDAEKTGEEVWVAEGTYTPTATADRSIAIMLRSGVAIYGGFKGTEQKLDQRDWKEHVTIFSGDIGEPGDDNDNSMHVVMGADNAIMDGFTITGGNGTQRDRQGPPGPMGPRAGGRGAGGGGVPLPGGPGVGGGRGPQAGGPGIGGRRSPQAGGPRGIGGRGPQAGGLGVGAGRGPLAGGPGAAGRGGEEGGGGGIHISPQIILQGAGPHGAGMLNYQCAPTVRNCIFRQNKAGKAGAMYNMASKQFGPARTQSSEPAPLIIGCCFIENYAFGRGGAVSNDLGTNPTFIDCEFINNSTDGKGGAIYDDFFCSPTIVNCLFAGNSAMSGGAIGNDGGSSPTITNCTFTGNHADDSGAALYQGSGGANDPIVTNCILWGNEVPLGPSEIYAWHESNPIITFSCVQGGYPGRGNIDADPRFVDPDDGDYRLGPHSPCVDVGNGSMAPEKDRDGNPRYDDKGMPDGHAAIPGASGPGRGGGPGFDRGRPGFPFAPARLAVDVGAYERQEDTKLPAREAVFVDLDNVRGPWDGGTWPTAFKTIQPGLDRAYTAGAEVWVAEGVYKPTAGRDRGVSIRLRKGVPLYGGFQGTETKRSQRDWVKNPTILSGDVGIQNDIRDNSYHVLIGEDAAVLDGFSITGGNADDTVFDAKGGGMVNYRSNASQGQGSHNAAILGLSPIISNCVFVKNFAIDGGAIYNFDRGTPKLTNCAFLENSAHYGGAIVDRVGVQSVLTNCTFSGNHAKWRGGAYYVDYGSRSQVVNCTFSENSSDGHGGGIYTISRASQLENTVLDVVNCAFDANSAKGRGGGMAIYEDSILTLSDSTFTNNRAGTGGGGLSSDYRSRATLTDCTFDGNSAVEGAADVDTDESSQVERSR